MTPATSFVSKPSSFPIPWSSWTTKSPVRRSANDWSDAPADPALTWRPSPEDLGVRQEDEPELAPDEPAARGRDGEEQLRLPWQRLARLDDPRLDPAQQVLLAHRLAHVREGDDDAVARTDECSQLVLRLGKAPCDERRLLRLEREWLAGRERVEARGAPKGNRLEALLLPHLAHLVDRPDQVWPRRERRHEVFRHRNRLVVVAQRRLVKVEAPLGGRIDDGALDRVERTLRERGERADPLDLVAEELDPQRLAPGRREDIHETAPDRELAALVGALDTFVARERQRLREGVELELEAGLDADRIRACARLGHQLRQRGGRGTDEAAGGEDVERPCPLADEVGCRLQPRLPPHAAARQERNPLLPEEPPGSLGRIARVGVLGGEQDERASELLVQRGEQQRQRRLRHARSGRKRRRVGA